jgi:hypothetical protein
MLELYNLIFFDDFMKILGVVIFILIISILSGVIYFNRK